VEKLEPQEQNASHDSARKLGKFGLPEVISISALLLTLNLFISSYFGRNLLEFLSFFPSDGWCLNNQRGLGVHCFGDFGANLISASQGLDYFYGSNSLTRQYPPMNYYLYSFFHTLANNTNYGTSLMLFLMIMSAGILIPITSILRKSTLPLIKIVVITLGSFSLLPIIITLDRGNSVGLAIPFLFFYMYPKEHTNKFKRLLLISILSNIKPHFAVILLLRFRLRKWRESVEEVIAIIASYVLFFLIGSPANTGINIRNFLDAILNYVKIDLNRQYPYNYSFAQGLHNIASGVFQVEVPQATTSYLASWLSVLALLLILWKKEKLTYPVVATLLLPLIMLIPGMSAPYYSIVLLPILIAQISIFDLRFPAQIGGNITKALFTGSLMLSILPLYMGNDMLGVADNPHNVFQILIPGAWVVSYSVFAISTLLSGFGFLKKRSDLSTNSETVN
jgi:hypothetical protein